MALRPGGILVSYLPTIGQVARLREELDGSPFGLAETLEVLQRTWHVEGQSVRPDHRMVAHTGFLTAARLLDPDLPGLGLSPETPGSGFPEPGEGSSAPETAPLNLLDLLIILMAAAAAYGGYRLGFLARIFSWAGLAVGALVADRFLPDVVAFFSSSDPQIRLIAAISFLVGASMLGQGVGLAVGQPAPRRPPARHRAAPGRPGRRLGAGNHRGHGGGVAPHAGAARPCRAGRPKPPRGSAIAHLVDDVAPAPPETMQALRRFVQDGTFPAVFNELRRSPDPGPPPIDGLPEAVHQRVVQSTVKVTGEACRRIQEGSGFVAMPDMVVTNAHVVAGEKAPRVETVRGEVPAGHGGAVRSQPRPRPAAGAGPDRAAAAVRRPRPRRATPVPSTGTPAAGDLRPAPAKISQELIAVGRDIYDRNDTRRSIFVLASALRPG